jgi:hypothetical protein
VRLNATSNCALTAFAIATHMLGRFIISMLPLVMIIFSAYSYVEYSNLLDENVDKIRLELTSSGTAVPTQSLMRKDILATGGNNQILPRGTPLQGWYLSIFLSAELAFVLMALREYGYSILHMSEQEVLGRASSVT